MKLNKKKKGFTLIELMAVIAIVAILAAVLVPTVSGYITRSKKTAYVTQVRTLINAVETYNITSANKIADTDSIGAVATAGSVAKKLSDAELVATDLKDINQLVVGTTVTIGNYRTINNDTDVLNNLTYDKTNKVFKYTISGSAVTVSGTIN